MNAQYYAYVDPTSFELAYPDVYMGAHEFGCYVKKAINAYMKQSSTDIGIAKFIISQVKN